MAFFLLGPRRAKWQAKSRPKWWLHRYPVPASTTATQISGIDRDVWVKFQIMTFQSGAKVKWTQKSFWEIFAHHKSFETIFEWERERCRWGAGGVEPLESKQVWKAALGVDGKLLTVVQKVDLSLFKWKYSCSTSLSVNSELYRFTFRISNWVWNIIIDRSSM